MLDLQKPASIVNITDPAVTQTWTYLTDPILLADIDLTNIEDLTIERSVSATVRSKGIANGVLIFFEADLTPIPCSILTPRFRIADAWANPVWLFERFRFFPGQNA